MNEHFVRIENLTKTYLEGEKRCVVLQAAQTKFADGKTAVILGKSGSGKSVVSIERSFQNAGSSSCIGTAGRSRAG